MARSIGLGNYLTLGAGEAKGRGRERDSILADATEAVIGAVYLDGGHEACRTSVLRIFAVSLRDLAPGAQVKDPKTELQEWLQARGMPLPEYTVVRTDGAPHSQIFTVSCRVLALPERVQGAVVAPRNRQRRANRSRPSAMDKQGFRCGYIAVIGRPNVGKSTLINRIVGRKTSITSRKPQTTRPRILAIKNSAEYQAIFVDTPGIHLSTRRALNRLMNRAARGALEGVDLVVLVVEALRWTTVDSYILEQVARERTPLFLAVNKIDRLPARNELLPYLDRVSAEGHFAEIVPISAERGDNVERLLRLAVSQLPMAEAVFGRETVTDRSPRFIAAELVREKLTNRLGQEVPYQLAVNVDGYTERARLISIDATIWVERKGQKAIVIGNRGQVLKAVGEAARREMEAMLRRKVLLRLWVKVREDWSDNEAALHQLGYGG